MLGDVPFDDHLDRHDLVVRLPHSIRSSVLTALPELAACSPVAVELIGEDAQSQLCRPIGHAHLLLLI